MSHELRDLRAKISPKADQVLAGVAHARNCEKSELVRAILDEWAAKVIHECTVVNQFVGCEGCPGRVGE
jgi:hypothetical protein